MLNLAERKGFGHDKFYPKIFSTPPRLVAFAIQAPALRTATGSSHPLGFKSDIRQT